MSLHLVGDVMGTRVHSGAKVAVIGGGISGLTAAYKLRDAADVTLFEANDYVGGHTNTIDIELDGLKFPVDTGFLVFNERTYPNLIALFEELGVETALSDMSFAVCLPEIDLEWSGTNLDTVFAQRKNLLSPRFLRMIKDILRFNKQSTEMAMAQADSSVGQNMQMPLDQFLQINKYSKEFINWYLLPMAAAIWSCPSSQMMAFPMATFVRFCHNHGLLQVENRPRWFTVKAGARHYVEKILPFVPRVEIRCPALRVTPLINGGVDVETRLGIETFDAVVIAAHSDQAHAMLGESNPKQRALLKNIRYQDNTAFLHTDLKLMPKRKKVWSSWNYLSDVTNPQPSVSVTYWLNRLQPLPFTTDVMVTLNPIVQPDAKHVIREIHYSHPIFDGPAIEAQQRLDTTQGEGGVFLAGAWAGYGFHEDGHKAGLRAAELLRNFLNQRNSSLQTGNARA
jgi:predicted NAD/FAD-binding protein